MKRKEVGQLGEQLAAGYLERAGYRVLRRNYRCQLGEIDIIAMDGRTLVFVEVRTRTGQDYGTAVESITPAKLDRLRRLALFYIQAEHGNDIPCRIDLVAVELGDLRGRRHRIDHMTGISDG